MSLLPNEQNPAYQAQLYLEAAALADRYPSHTLTLPTPPWEEELNPPNQDDSDPGDVCTSHPANQSEFGSGEFSCVVYPDDPDHPGTGPVVKLMTGNHTKFNKEDLKDICYSLGMDSLHTIACIAELDDLANRNGNATIRILAENGMLTFETPLLYPSETNMIELNTLLQQLYLAQYEQDQTLGEKAEPIVGGIVTLGAISLLSWILLSLNKKNRQPTKLKKPAIQADSQSSPDAISSPITHTVLNQPFSHLLQKTNGHPTADQVEEFVQKHKK